MLGKSLLQRNPGVVEEGIFDTFKQVIETGTPRHDERHYVPERFGGWFIQSVVRLGDGVATTTKGITAWKVAQEDVFQPFGRAVNAATSQIQGMGLGLDIARRIVEAHDGRV